MQNKAKKYAIILLAVSLTALLLVGCGGKKSTVSKSTAGSSQTAKEEQGDKYAPLSLEEAKAFSDKCEMYYGYYFVRKNEKFYIPFRMMNSECGGWFLLCKQDEENRIVELSKSNGDELAVISNGAIPPKTMKIVPIEETGFTIPLNFSVGNALAPYGFTNDLMKYGLTRFSRENYSILPFNEANDSNSFSSLGNVTIDGVGFDEIDPSMIKVTRVGDYGSSDCILALDQNQMVSIEHYEGTDYYQHDFKAEYRYFVVSHNPNLNKKETYVVDLNVEPTPNGYFRADIDDLENGYYAIPGEVSGTSLDYLKGYSMIKIVD